MCHSCYVEYTGGEPVEVTSEMIQTMELIRHLYTFPWGITGGPLHVELDDMNLDDSLFDAAHRELLVGPGGFKHRLYADELTREDWDLCLAIFDRLAAMTEAQRAETVYRADPW